MSSTRTRAVTEIYPSRVFICKIRMWSLHILTILWGGGGALSYCPSHYGQLLYSQHTLPPSNAPYMYSISHVIIFLLCHKQCSELVTIQFGDVDGHLSQIMQKIAGRMGLPVTVRRKEVCVSGPFDLVQQFRMDLRAEVFLNAQCSSYTSVTTASSQPPQYTQPPPKKAVQFSADGPQGTRSRSFTMMTTEPPPEQQSIVNISNGQVYLLTNVTTDTCALRTEICTHSFSHFLA